MALNLGTTPIQKLHLGAAAVQKLYLGTSLVWQTGPSGPTPDRELDFSAGADAAALSALGFATTRAGTKLAWPASFTKPPLSFAANTPRLVTGRGLMISPARTNKFLNSMTPATQTISGLSGSHVCSMIGAGSITLSGGATGTVTQDAPLVFTPSAAVTFTVSGSVDYAAVEAGGYAGDAPIETTGSAVTANADQIQRTFTGGSEAPPMVAVVEAEAAWRWTAAGQGLWNFGRAPTASDYFGINVMDTAVALRYYDTAARTLYDNFTVPKRIRVAIKADTANQWMSVNGRPVVTRAGARTDFSLWTTERLGFSTGSDYGSIRLLYYAVYLQDIDTALLPTLSTLGGGGGGGGGGASAVSLDFTGYEP